MEGRNNLEGNFDFAFESEFDTGIKFSFFRNTRI